MDALDTRPIVIPGNHDVFAWWFPLRRLFTPLRRYRAFVRGDLDSLLRIDDVAFVALSAAWGWTVKGGIFRPGQVEQMKRFLNSNRDARRRVLIVHHPIRKSRLTRRGDVARRSELVLDAAAECGIDIILDGHIHCAGVEILHAPARSMIHCMAGTATSDRGRYGDVGANRYSLVRLHDDVSVEQRTYVAAEQQFVSDGSVTLVSADRGWVKNESVL